MAEYLIYDKVHWMDELSDADVQARVTKDPYFESKYNSRYQKGDIVEVRPDGFWTGVKGKSFNKKAFRVVSVPHMTVDTKYHKPQRIVLSIRPGPEDQPELERVKYSIKARAAWRVDVPGLDKTTIVQEADFKLQRKE